MRDYNFFEVFFEERRTSNLRKFYIGIFVIVITSLIAGSYAWSFLKVQKVEKDIVKIEQILKEKNLDKAEQERNRKIKEVEILQKYYDAIYTINNIITGNDIIDTKFMKTINNQVPKKMYFQTMDVNYERVSITGISENRNAVAELEYNLKKSEIFKDVHVSIINLALEEVVVEKNVEDIESDNLRENEENDLENNRDNQKEEKKPKTEKKEVGYSFSITCTIEGDENAAKDK